MSPIRDSAGAALTKIRAQIRLGVFPPGAPLAITVVANELALSPTPVREALAHLAGEGLVVERRGQGYFAEMLDAQGLIELYDLHHLLVAAALVRPRRWAPEVPILLTDRMASVDDASLTAEVLFDTIIAAAGDITLRAVHRRVADRLAAVRRIEPWVLGAPDAELNFLADHFLAGDADALLVGTADYQARRVAAASDLIVALRSNLAMSNIEQI